MSDSKKPASKSTKPIADVAHPGESAPSTSSRPVIITNRPILKDPMVVDESALPKTEEKKPAAKPNSEEGNSPQAAPELVETAPQNEAKQPPQADTKEAVKHELQLPVTPQADSVPAPDKEQQETTAEPSADEHTEAPGTDVGRIPDETAELKQQAEHDAAIDKLADSKQFYLPINTVEKRRSKRVLILGILLSLLLIFAWVDIALDAGLIQIDNVKPLTHFFSIEPSPITFNKAATITKAAPVTQNKTFTSSLDGLSFQYPSDWEVNNLSLTTGNEQQWARPSSVPFTDIASTLAVPISTELTRNQDVKFSSVKNPPILVKVQYTPLTKTGSPTLYLREITYKTNTVHPVFNMSMSIADAKTSEKVGETISNIDTNFLAKDGKTPMVFNGIIKYVKNGQLQPGYVSLSQAQAVMKSSSYVQAKKILLSLKLSTTQ